MTPFADAVNAPDFRKNALEKIAADTDRDFFMTAQEAVDYGLADGIITEL